MEEYESEVIEKLINGDISVKDLCIKFTCYGAKRGFLWGLFFGISLCTIIVLIIQFLK